MKEPVFNTYLITLAVRDVCKADAVALAEHMRLQAMKTDTKSDFNRTPTDVSVTVAHVKGSESYG
jgi:hypothetical protein